MNTYYFASPRFFSDFDNKISRSDDDDDARRRHCRPNLSFLFEKEKNFVLFRHKIQRKYSRYKTCLSQCKDPTKLFTNHLQS